jgi:hypothetical protein
MTAEASLRAVLAAIPGALDASRDLIVDGARLYTLPIMGRRRPRKPWRIGVDGPSLSAVLQIEEIDAAWMPLAGGTGFDALEMMVDSINAHAGIEIDAMELSASIPGDCLRWRFEAHQRVDAWQES